MERHNEWLKKQWAKVEHKQDAIYELADEIYADMKDSKSRRVKGERQLGALVGLGFEEWVGPWGGYTSPDRHSNRVRILNSLRHKPYYANLVNTGITGHPQRKVGLRAEWLKPYAYLDGDAVKWGLEDTRERQELFNADYDWLYIKVIDIDDKDIIDERKSTLFGNETMFGLDEGTYRFEVGCAGQGWNRFGKWFDLEIADNQKTPGSSRKPVPREDDNTEQEVIVHNTLKDAVINYIKTIRDDPPNRAVKGNRWHIQKWNRVLATLGVRTGEFPMSIETIRQNAAKWPHSAWAKAASVLNNVKEQRTDDRKAA